MTFNIVGGFLQPKPIDPNEPKPNLVWGADAEGRYLGVVAANDPRVVSVVSRPPPKMIEERCRWRNSDWVFERSRDEIVDGIERERDAIISQGVTWQGFQWYADQTFQQQLGSFLVMWQEGILGNNDKVAIRAMDGMMHDLGREEVRDLAKLVAAHVQDAYRDSWEKKAEAGV